MALSVLLGIATIFGTSEGIRQSQATARRDEHRTRKCNIIVRCAKSSQYSSTIEGKRLVLSGDKLYIDTNMKHNEPFGHPFSGYFLPYPETKYSGLVSSISDDPPIMNWIYVDRDTFEIKFGTRPYAENNLNGPFDCTREERRLNFGGWEGFVVVKEGNFWALYFDCNSNNLKGKVEPGTIVLEVELLRKETRGRPLKRDDLEAEAELPNSTVNTAATEFE